MNNHPRDPNKDSFWNQISTNALVRFLLFFASGWAILAIIEYFENIFFIFSFAAILAFLLNYPVRYLEKFLGRGFALGIVIVVTLVIIISSVIILGLSVLTQLEQLIILISDTLNSADSPLDRLVTFLAQRNIIIDLTLLEETLKNTMTSSISFFITGLSSLPNTFISFIIILVISFFMLIDGEKLWLLIIKIVPVRQRLRFSSVIQQSFLGFFRAQVIISLLLGLAIFIVFLILKIPFTLTLSLIMTFFYAIPGPGAALGILTISLLTLVQSGWITGIKVIVSSLILQQIQDNLVAPRIMQSAVNLNPVVVFFAVMIGAKVAHLWGIFLSVPIAAAVVSWLEIEEMQSSKSKTIE
ncbi:MAG: AI-2E family transporter [Prochloraceae cyanobacterium]|nr:AI-2E family transporter [Prochloraceae cyanobacterium]